jgi:hypothetical protein
MYPLKTLEGVSPQTLHVVPKATRNPLLELRKVAILISSAILAGGNTEAQSVDFIKNGACEVAKILNAPILFGVAILIGIIVYGWSSVVGKNDGAASLRNAIIGIVIITSAGGIATAMFASAKCA